MDNKNIEMLAMRALDELIMRMDSFSCTLTLLLQESLEGKELRPRLLNPFRAEEPLVWHEWLIDELNVKVLNELEKHQLVWLDNKTGKELLVLNREELEVTLEDFKEQDGE